MLLSVYKEHVQYKRYEHKKHMYTYLKLQVRQKTNNEDMITIVLIWIYLYYINTHTLHYISTFYCAIPNELNTEFPNIIYKTLKSYKT